LLPLLQARDRRDPTPAAPHHCGAGVAPHHLLLRRRLLLLLLFHTLLLHAVDFHLES
jgi:hypothetical protein